MRSSELAAEQKVRNAARSTLRSIEPRPQPVRRGWSRWVTDEILGEFGRLGEAYNGDPMVAARGQRRVG